VAPIGSNTALLGVMRGPGKGSKRECPAIGVAAVSVILITAAQIGYEIYNAGSESQGSDGGGNREGFVNGLMEKSDTVTRSECNIMIMNKGNDFERDLKGYQHFKKNGIFWVHSQPRRENSHCVS